MRNQNGGVLLYAAADSKGPLATRQLWNLWEIWAAKASDCHVSALLEAEAVQEIQLRSVRREPDAEQITEEAEVRSPLTLVASAGAAVAVGSAILRPSTKCF